MKSRKGKKLPFRFARVLAIFPLSGTQTRKTLVSEYNSVYGSRILATLKLDRLFGVIMTPKRMSRILSALVEVGYLRLDGQRNLQHYRLTPAGVQAKLNQKR